MNNDIREDVFDTVLSSAFAEYVDREMEALPSKEELAKMYPIPKDGLRKLKRSIKKNRPVSKATVYLRRVAIIFLAAVALFTGVMATSVEVRSAVGNAIVSLFDKFASVSFGDEPHMPAETKIIENVDSFEIGYVPDGLALMETFEDEDNRKYTYSSDDGDFLHISIYSTNSAEYAGDIELSQYETININNIEGHIFYYEEEKSGSLIFENNGYTVMISCILDRDELIMVAENIK